MELVSSIVEDFNDTSIMDFKSRYFSSTQISLVFNLSIFFLNLCKFINIYSTVILEINNITSDSNEVYNREICNQYPMKYVYMYMGVYVM